MTVTRPALAAGTLAVLVAVAGCSSGTSTTSAPSRSSTPATSDSPTTATTPSTTAAAAPPTTSPTAPALTPGRHVVSFDVDGVARSAIVVVPRGPARPAPLVFVFHGHGGRGAGIARQLGIHRLWRDAIVVYPDGLTGHQGITDPQGLKPGWQARPGESGDRDLALYDTMLSTIERELPVDRDRVSVVGHSNGSAFASLLLHERGDGIAAVATLSAQPGPLLLPTDPIRSMFMAMGRQDAVVPFANQQRSIPLAEQRLGIDPATATVDGLLRTARGTDGVELATYVYPGGHAPPPEVAPLVVDFLRRQRLPAR
jgi:polyhydroxybutyrate depolymerase